MKAQSPQRRGQVELWIGMSVWAVCQFCHAGPVFVDVAASANLISNGPTQAVLPEIQTQSQIITYRNLGNGAAVGDYDNDGDLDVYICTGLGYPNVLYRNNLNQGKKTFTDVTALSGAGLGDIGASRVAHFVDLDNDGWLDLLVVNDYNGTSPPSKLFRNNGDGTFTDVTAGSGFEPFGWAKGGASLTDYDGDGLLDIYVTNWSSEYGLGQPAFPGENELYHNLGGFLFEDVSEQVGLAGLSRDSFTAIFTDFDGDRDPDIYVAIDHTPDVFYLNKGGFFVDATDQTQANHGFNDMGAACADFDNDGDLDLYSTNITDPDKFYGNLGSGRNVFYVNQLSETGNLVFQDQAKQRGVEDTYWGWGTDFFDVDSDGDLDLFAVTGFEELIDWAHPHAFLSTTPSVLFLNNGAGYFTRNYAPGLQTEPDSRCLVVFDYDRDGDEDLLVINVNEPLQLLENITTNQGHWLRVALRQKAGLNRNGIGAILRAKTSSLTRRREILAGESYLAGTPAEAYFGLGSTTLIDELSIEWTDGSVTKYPNVPVDQYLTIDQANPIQRVARSLTITGPSTAGADSIAQFSADADFYYSEPEDVTAQATWTVEPEGYAEFTGPGTLSVGSVDEEIALTLRASLDGYEDQATVLLLATPYLLDLVAPTVQITQPTTLGQHTTTLAALQVSGAAQDDHGVALVRWANADGSRLEEGECSGLESFSCGPIDLAVGLNQITITATDFAGHSDSAELSVIRSDQPLVEQVSHLAASAKALDFGEETESITLKIWNTSVESQTYSLESDQTWLQIDPVSGTSGNVLSPALHTLLVDRDAMTPGTEASAVVMVMPEDENVAPLQIDVVAARPEVVEPPPDLEEPPISEPPDDQTPPPPQSEEPPVIGDDDPTDPSEDPMDQPPAAEPPGDTGPAPVQNSSPTRMCGAMGTLPLMGLLAGLSLRRRRLH